jgi:hypothetical protein
MEEEAHFFKQAKNIVSKTMLLPNGGSWKADVTKRILFFWASLHKKGTTNAENNINFFILLLSFFIYQFWNRIIIRHICLGFQARFCDAAVEKSVV